MFFFLVRKVCSNLGKGYFKKIQILNFDIIAILPLLLFSKDAWNESIYKSFFFICCSCELSIHQRNQQISILEWFLKDRDTEDWSNDAENVALNYMNKLHFIIYSNSKLSLNCSNIFFLQN